MTPLFRVGEIVEATTYIRRVDGMSHLRVGEIATVTRIFTTERATIVDISITGRHPMCDIVCFDDKTPLKHRAY